MPNVAAVLKQEILRVSRRGSRADVSALRKSSAQQRRDIAALKREVSALGRQVKLLLRRGKGAAPQPASAARSTQLRFSAKGLRTQRKRLGLSAGDFGRLVGSSAQSVYNWEQEKATPRMQQVAAIASLRAVGKREATARLKAAGANSRRAARSGKK